MKSPYSAASRGYLRLLPLLFAALTPSIAAAGWVSDRLTTHEEVFRWADLDKNNNLNATERDLLRIAFKNRNDLHILDLNRNQKLDREEIDYLEGDRRKKKKGKGKKN